jgi:hypothetical protein
VTENLGLDSLIGDTAQATYVESDKRVRKALKLIAFYLEVRHRYELVRTGSVEAGS